MQFTTAQKAIFHENNNNNNFILRCVFVERSYNSDEKSIYHYEVLINHLFDNLNAF